MFNMTRIQPIHVPTKGNGELFQLTALNFPMNPQSVTFYWQVFSIQLVEETIQLSECVLDGNLTMDSETYSQWGNNDTFCIQWACEELGFTIIS